MLQATMKISWKTSLVRTGLVSLALLLGGGGRAEASDNVAGNLITVNDNGAWSWFEDARAIIDAAAGKIVVSSVANSSGAGGTARHGDIDVASLDLATGVSSRFVLHDSLQADDHNSAALWIRPDGRYLSMYGGHVADNFSRWRISANAGDISVWSAEQTFNNNAAMTYSNLHFLPNDAGGAGRLYNFVRSVGFDPNIMVSSDHGSTWSYSGRLLTEGGNSDRPYLRYASDGNRIHLIATDRHPRDFNNSVYHAYIEDGRLYDSAGAVIDGNLFDGAALAPSQLTSVFAANTVVDGTSMQRAWTVDLEIDGNGRPVGVFQARAGGNALDHRFFYSRWDGDEWQVHPLGYAGSNLYAAENDYTGLVAIDPDDPDTVYLSSEVHPATQAQLIGADGVRHYELFRGRTADGGANWNWTPVTFNSTVDNLRPVVPKWNAENTGLLWLRGEYSTYTNYDLRVVALINPELSEPTHVLSVDFGATGQFIQDGFSAFTREQNPAGASQTELYSSSFANGGQLSVAVGGDVQFRDRGDDVAGPIGDVVDDFVYNAGTLQLTFGNLQAGDYQLVLHSHDRDFLQEAYRIVLDGLEVGMNVPTAGATPEIGSASSRVQFSADGTGDVTFSLESLSGGNVVLNGFELYAAEALTSLPGVDLNFDGLLNLADYQLYSSGLHADLSGLSAIEAYSKGDLNGDLANNYADFLLFRQAYDAWNGAGAFAAAVGVPEPSGATAALLSLIALRVGRPRFSISTSKGCGADSLRPLTPPQAEATPHPIRVFPSLYGAPHDAPRY